MRPVASPAVDEYAPRSGYQYQEEMVEGYDLRERARELEEYLRDRRESLGLTSVPMEWVLSAPASRGLMRHEPFHLQYNAGGSFPHFLQPDTCLELRIPVCDSARRR
jgi:hypothetical protein